LAGLLLSKSHVLLLDEPTNHLDFETVEALGRALKHFAGTVFFISHDRTFVNLVATQIIEVKDGRVLKYPGTYEDYVYHLEQVAQGIQEEENREHARHVKMDAKKHAQLQEKPSEAQEARKERARLRTELTKLESKAKKVESRMSHLTKERDKLVSEMQQNTFHFSKARNDRLREITIDLEEAEGEWLKLSTQIEQLKGEQAEKSPS